MQEFPIVERLRALMGNARREDMREYEKTAADAVDRILKLEAMLRAAGYSDAQIVAGTPYVEVMGS